VKQWITNYLLRHLLGVVVPEDVITTDKGKLLLGGKVVEENELRSLISEVKALEGLRIYKIFNETIRNEAMDRGFNKSTSFDDLKSCKLMLYNLDVLNSICRVIRSLDK